MATVAGNLFELKQFSGLKLLDIRLPPAFATAYEGPRFGIAGTRRLVGVEGRPLIGTIIKPSVGLGPEETAELVRTLAEAGIDFIKDDELQGDGPACPFEDRARAVMRAINEVAERKGRKTMFAFNLTGDLDEMRRRHDLVQALGGTCIMASVNSVGLAGMIALGRHSALPIHAHRNGWGYLSRHPLLGFSFTAWHKVWRLAGADHIHVNGLANKFSEEDDSVIASARACLAPLFPDKPCPIMPVFSSGQTVRQAPSTWQALGSTDLINSLQGVEQAGPDLSAARLRQMAVQSLNDPSRTNRMNRAPLAERLDKLAQLTIAIQFDFNSARIRPSSFAAVGLMADALYHPYLQGYRFLIVGHTDAKGNREYNLKLSQQRADAIREALINPFGISPARIESVGLGEEQLLKPAAPEAAENRRVQLINIGRGR